MRIVQTSTFRKAVRKLHANQKQDLDVAVRVIADNPSVGDEKDR